MTHTFTLGSSDVPSLQQTLADNFGQDLAGSILTCLQTYQAAQEQPDYMEVKALSEIMEGARHRARTALAQHRAWRRTAKLSKFDHPLFKREGALLRVYAVDALALYRESKLTFHAAYQVAMARIRLASKTSWLHAMDDDDFAPQHYAKG